MLRNTTERKLTNICQTVVNCFDKEIANATLELKSLGLGRPYWVVTVNLLNQKSTIRFLGVLDLTLNQTLTRIQDWLDDGGKVTPGKCYSMTNNFSEL